MSSPLVSKRMLRALAQFFNAKCRLLTVTTTQDPDTGEEVETPVIADEVIRAYVEPVNTQQEVRRPDQTLALSAFNIALQGYYPQISLGDQLQVSRNHEAYVTHDVLSVMHDDTNSVTFLITEEA